MKHLMQRGKPCVTYFPCLRTKGEDHLERTKTLQ